MLQRDNPPGDRTLAHRSPAGRSRFLLAAALLAGCAEGVGPGPGGGPALVAIVAGDGQSGTAGQTLAVPIVARVTDDAGRPVPDALVVFAPEGGAMAPAARRAQIQDTKCAIRHLRTNAALYGLDPARIGAFGASAGGQLVGLLGTADAAAGFDDAGEFPGVSSRVQAAVALSPITDFTAPEELRDDYSRVFLTWPQPDSPEMIQASPVTHVTPDDSPFLFVVGEADTLVLPAQSARMDGLLRGAGVPSSLVTVRHADHGLNPTTEAISPTRDQVIAEIVAFFDRYLR